MHEVPYGKRTLWQCDECPRNFLSKRAAERHVGTHSRGQGVASGEPLSFQPPPDNDDDGDEPTTALIQPATTATKAVWAAYAASRGVDTEGLTKKQLIERSTL